MGAADLGTGVSVRGTNGGVGGESGAESMSSVTPERCWEGRLAKAGGGGTREDELGVKSLVWGTGRSAATADATDVEGCLLFVPAVVFSSALAPIKLSLRGGEVGTGGSKLKGRRGVFEVAYSLGGSTISTLLCCRI